VGFATSASSASTVRSQSGVGRTRSRATRSRTSVVSVLRACQGSDRGHRLDERDGVVVGLDREERAQEVDHEPGVPAVEVAQVGAHHPHAVEVATDPDALDHDQRGTRRGR
jgi:hypothetical protein